jgi:Tubulin-tyrosine ligase family
MIDDISEVPLNESLVISRYIDNPLLINGLKFDLRLYVLVTSFDPLKIYVYNEGLVRFASEPYNTSNIKQNVYAHLTNYSINKKSENFI